MFQTLSCRSSLLVLTDHEMAGVWHQWPGLGISNRTGWPSNQAMPRYLALKQTPPSLRFCGAYHCLQLSAFGIQAQYSATHGGAGRGVLRYRHEASRQVEGFGVISPQLTNTSSCAARCRVCELGASRSSSCATTNACCVLIGSAPERGPWCWIEA